MFGPVDTGRGGREGGMLLYWEWLTGLEIFAWIGDDGQDNEGLACARYGMDLIFRWFDVGLLVSVGWSFVVIT